MKYRYEVKTMRNVISIVKSRCIFCLTNTHRLVHNYTRERARNASRGFFQVEISNLPGGRLALPRRPVVLLEGSSPFLDERWLVQEEGWGHIVTGPHHISTALTQHWFEVPSTSSLIPAETCTNRS